MIDPKLIRENPELVKENYKMRQKPELLTEVDKFVEWDKKWRKYQKEVENLRKERNVSSKSISKLKGAEKKEAIVRMKEVNSKLQESEKLAGEAEEKRKFILDRLPNLLHDSVPYGKDDEDNVEMSKWGKKPKFDFEPLAHHEIIENLNLVELERARKVSGARFYYLKGKLAILEQALIRYAMDVVMENGYEIYSTPTMVRPDALYGTGFLPTGDEDIYKIKDENLALIGTSEVALGGLYSKEVFIEDELPMRLAGFSNCYRTEASASNKDDKGIFRVHEFKKVEMFVFSHPDKSWEEQDRLITVAQKVFQGLGLHYRLVNICTGDIGAVASKKIDIEVWLPGQNRYREVVSCSNCTDYQARRLQTKYREKEGSPVKGFVHTLNSTALATTRPMIAILENFQQKDGSIVIPEVLRKYTGFDKIEP